MPSEMHIRPFEPGDRPALEALGTAVWGANGVAAARFRASLSAGALVAERGGRLEGAGGLWENRLHPRPLYLSLGVHPGARRQGVGGALFDRLSASFEGRPVRAATGDAERDARRFLERRGFLEVKRTYTPTVAVAGLDLAPFESAAARVIGLGYALGTAADFAPGPDRDARLTALHLELYRDAHEDNPLAELSLDAWHEVFLDDLAPELAAVAMWRGEYAAVTSLRPGDGTGLELAWTSAASGHRAQAPDLTLAVVGRVLEEARRRGIEGVALEVDTTDPAAMLVLEHLPVKPGPAWITLERLGVMTAGSP